MEGRCLPGLTPFHFIVFTDAATDPAEGYMRYLVANRIDKYYPGIVGDEITLTDAGAGYGWAGVGKLKNGAWWRTTLEDIDHWSPVVINVAAIILFMIFTTIPWLWTTIPDILEMLKSKP